MPRHKSANPKGSFIRARVTGDFKNDLNTLLALENKSEADFLREAAEAYVASRRGLAVPAGHFGVIVPQPGGSAGNPVPPVWSGTPVPFPGASTTGSVPADQRRFRTGDLTVGSGSTHAPAGAPVTAFHGDPKTNGVDGTKQREYAVNR